MGIGQPALRWNSYSGSNTAGLFGAMSRNINAQNKSLQGVANAFTNASDRMIAAEDRELEAADRLFKRESDLLQRDIQRQQQAKNQFGLDTQQQVLDSKLANELSNRSRATQLANQSRTEFNQEQQTRTDTQDLTQLYINAKNNNPDKSEREIITGLQNHMASTDRQYDPTATANIYKNLSAGYSNTGSEDAAIKRKADSIKRQDEINKYTANNKAKVTAAKLKADAKSKSKKDKDSFFGSNTNNQMATEAAVLNADKSDLDTWSSVEADSDTQELVRNFIKPFQNLGYDVAPIVKQATRPNGYFDSKKAAKLFRLKNIELGIDEAKGAYDEATQNKKIAEKLKADY